MKVGDAQAFILPAPKPKPEFQIDQLAKIVQVRRVEDSNKNQSIVVHVKNLSEKKLADAYINLYQSTDQYLNRKIFSRIEIPVFDAFNEIVLSELLPPPFYGEEIVVELVPIAGLENVYPYFPMMGQTISFTLFDLSLNTWNAGLVNVDAITDLVYTVEDLLELPDGVRRCDYEMLLDNQMVFALPAPGLVFYNADARYRQLQRMADRSRRNVNFEDMFTMYDGHWRMHNGNLVCD